MTVTRVVVVFAVLVVIVLVQLVIALVSRRRSRPLSDEWRRGLNYDKEGMKP